MKVIIRISNGDTIQENFSPELTVKEIGEFIISKYVPESTKIRFLLNSKILNPDAKLSEIGYTPGTIIICYPSPALKPKSTPEEKKIETQENKSEPVNPKVETQENKAEPMNPKPEPGKKIPKDANSQKKKEKPRPMPPRTNPSRPARMESMRPLKPNPKCEKVRGIIMEKPPYSLEAVVSSISKNDPVLADNIKKNPAPFLALMGVPFTIDDDGKLNIKTI